MITGFEVVICASIGTIIGLLTGILIKIHRIEKILKGDKK